MKTISLAVPHTPWVPERAESWARLGAQIGLENPDLPLKVFGEKCHFTKWATDMWAWMEETPADWALTLQDDVIVSESFWKDLRSIVDHIPESVDIICLESAHPLTPMLYACGDAWYTTPDQLIGTGYLVRPRVLGELRKWREMSLKPGAWFPGPQCVTEDTLLGIFATVTGRKIYSPTRTIIDHDVTIKSSYGNEWHSNRRPRMRWDNCDPIVDDHLYWTHGQTPVHLGRFYGDNVLRMIATWVIGITESDMARYQRDDGAAAIRKLIGGTLERGGKIEVCCLCGRNQPAINGMTGLQACPACIGQSAQALLAKMTVR